MCFSIHKDFKKPFKSEFDILVFKLGEFLYDNEGFKPNCYSDFRYTINKKTPKVKIEIFRNTIQAGYHSYVSLHTAKSNQDYEDRALFIIPKGTKFFYDPQYAEIVAERIIYVASGTKKYIKKFREKGAKLVSELKLKANSK